MITKTKTKKSDIAELFGLDSTPKTSSINKQILIAMAKNGESKPNRETKIGKALKNYIGKSSAAYDSVFAKLIKKLSPSWFLVENNSKQKKQDLIKIAKSGKPKPNSKKTKLGKVFRTYTCYKYSTYDIVFTKVIKELRPDWFLSTSQIAKQELIRTAKNDEAKPNQKTKLGTALRNYTVESSLCFDPIFNKQIRKLQPDWFDVIKHNSYQNKKELIRMAENGEDRPSRKSKLGGVLVSYRTKSSGCYDPIFTKKTKTLRPDWFRK